MRDLRHRLLDTEKQMTRILQAMQDVEEKVTDMSTELSVSSSFCHCAIIHPFQDHVVGCFLIFLILLPHGFYVAPEIFSRNLPLLPVYPSKYGPQCCCEQLE